MIYLMQIIRMLDKNQLELFYKLFNDISFELDEMGYRDFPEELVDDIMDNHFGIRFEDDRQLEMFTACILKHQGNLKNIVKALAFGINKNVA